MLHELGWRVMERSLLRLRSVLLIAFIVIVPTIVGTVVAPRAGLRAEKAPDIEPYSAISD